MRVVYIAGPFRGNSAWEIENNVRRAEETALTVWRMGAVALCPHANTRFFSGAAPDEVWLTGDLELLQRCDAVYLTLGWENSTGTFEEIIHACNLGIPVFEFEASVRLWLTYGIIDEIQSQIKAKAIQLSAARRAKAGP